MSLIILLISIVDVFPFFHIYAANALQDYGSPYIRVNAIDAYSKSPIRDVKILIWDMSSGVENLSSLLTDENGICIFKAAHEGRYLIYAYQGNLTSGKINYAPIGPIEVKLSFYETSRNITLYMLPSATVCLIGEIWTPEIPGFHGSFTVTIIDPKTKAPLVLEEGQFINTYNMMTRYFLRENGNRLNSSLIFIPAERSIDLKIQCSFYIVGTGFISFTTQIENINLRWKSEPEVFSLSYYSLLESIKRVRRESLLKISEEIDNLRRKGFYLLEEQNLVNKYMDALNNAERDLHAGNYYECWKVVSMVWRECQNIRRTLDYYLLASSSSAVYLPSFLAIYSIILASFLFEDTHKKIISSALLFALFIILLFYLYPGTRVILDPTLGNRNIFLASSAISFITTLGLFSLFSFRSRLGIEGLTSFRDIIETMLSLGKREIKARKLRGLLTICSVTLLVLAFTSFTSFGGVFGIVSERLNYTPSSEGILLKSFGNVTFTLGQNTYRLFNPMSIGYYETLRNDPLFQNIAPKIETYPNEKPILRIFSKTSDLPIYGLIGIIPEEEERFTRLNEIIISGSYLSEKDWEILISDSAARKLNVKPEDSVTLSTEGFSRTCIIRGIFDDSLFRQLTEIDGQPYAPKKISIVDEVQSFVVCSPDEIIIMSFNSALKLQAEINKINQREPSDPGTFNCLSRIAAKRASGSSVNAVIDVIVKSYGKEVYISEGGHVDRYFIGFLYEVKGALEITIPVVMVILNVGALMLNAVYERSKEMKTLVILGSNPTHIALLFIAEATILGMVGGGLGYLFGIGFYRIMLLFGSGLEVKEKIEWWWSFICFGIAVLVSVASALQPALRAVKLYTPSKIRRAKISEEDREARKREIFQVRQERRITMPVKVNESIFLIFINSLINYLRELSMGVYEKFTDIVEEPELQTPGGRTIKRIKFRYVNNIEKIELNNEITCSKEPKEDYYRVYLTVNLDQKQVSEEYVYRIANFVKEAVMEWIKSKDKMKI